MCSRKCDNWSDRLIGAGTAGIRGEHKETAAKRHRFNVVYMSNSIALMFLNK